MYFRKSPFGGMDVSGIRADFPSISEDGPVYLDSACQSLKPNCVIRKMLEYYTEYPGCGGRSSHSMATRVSMEVDSAREAFARFLNAESPSGVVFTKNCTEALNTVANGFGLGPGDAVLTSDSEHNSNSVPWLVLADRGVKRRHFPTLPDGTFSMDAYLEALTDDVKIVSVCHASNVTGHVFPVKDMAEAAHDKGIPICVDGAQAASHMPVDVRDLDVDFYCVSAHKMMAPSGVGALIGKKEALDGLRPLTYGGGAVGETSMESFTLPPVPDRLEAGLSNYSGIIGAGEAVRYLSEIGMGRIQEHILGLQRKIDDWLDGADGVSVVGPGDAAGRGAIFSFNVDGMLSYDVAMMMDSRGVLIRSGMHCAHPFFASRGIDGCARASFGAYNDSGDVGRLLSVLDWILSGHR